MIQLMFGRFFWVWIVTFLAAASYLSAISINQLMRISKKKTYKIPPSKVKFDGNEKRIRLSVLLRGANIFDPNGGMVAQPKTPKKVVKKVVKKKEPVKSKVPGCPGITADQKIKESKQRYLRLKGVSYTEIDPSMSVAAVYVKVKLKKGYVPPPPRKRISRKKGKKGLKRYKRRRRRRYRRYRRSRYNRRGSKTIWRTEVFRVGEQMMDGIRLCRITPDEIVIYRNRKLEKLVLRKKKKGRKLRYYGSMGVNRPSDNDGPGQVRIDAIDKRTISRSTVQNWLQNPMAHAMSARIMPHYANGQHKGLRLVWVRKKSLYSQLGLKTGDVVQSVNGKTLNVNNALGLYSELPYAKNLKVNIIRKGVRRQLFFNVK